MVTKIAAGIVAGSIVAVPAVTVLQHRVTKLENEMRCIHQNMIPVNGHQYSYTDTYGVAHTVDLIGFASSIDPEQTAYLIRAHC